MATNGAMLQVRHTQGCERLLNRNSKTRIRQILIFKVDILATFRMVQPRVIHRVPAAVVIPVGVFGQDLSLPSIQGRVIP
eukprot:832807-Prorocentrum_lima.AAC.1